VWNPIAPQSTIGKQKYGRIGWVVFRATQARKTEKEPEVTDRIASNIACSNFGVVEEM
jgi:hypothetical protein